MNAPLRTLPILILVTCVSASGCDREERAEGPSLASIAWDAPGSTDRSEHDAVTSFSRPEKPRAVEVIWQRLATYRSSFLRHWAQAFRGSDTPEASEITDALNELLIAVNGRGGFWRKTLAQGWLGCGEDGDSEPCRSFASVERALADGDALLEQLDALRPTSAARFLVRHEARILAYLDACVPAEASASAVRRTAVFRAHLARVLDDRIGGTRLSQSDP